MKLALNLGQQVHWIAYADDIALIGGGGNKIEIRKRFVEMENIARKFGLQINQEKTKYVIVERTKRLKNLNRAFRKKKKLQIWKSGECYIFRSCT